MFGLKSLFGGVRTAIQAAFPTFTPATFGSFRNMHTSSVDLSAHSRRGPINMFRNHMGYRVIQMRVVRKKQLKRDRSHVAERINITRWGYQHLSPKYYNYKAQRRLDARKLREVMNVKFLHVDQTHTMARIMPRNVVRKRQMPWITSPNQTRMRKVVGHSFG